MQKTKHILLMAAMLLSSFAVSAYDFVRNGIYYSITSAEDFTVAVTYRGNSYDSYSDEYSGAVTIPSTVTYNSKTYSVTSIGEFAFYNCSRLTSITIPESVTSIGFGAFLDCSSLTSITIPENVTSIGNSAFEGCYSLEQVTINCANVGDWFRGRSSLKKVVLGEGVTSIGIHAFRDCSGLTAITLPESVTSIGDQAFSYCSSLTAITIPEGVTSIGDYAFRECYSLTAITLPESVTSIGEGAFSYCRSLTAIVLPKKLKSVGSKAFANCTELLDVYCYAESVPSASSDAFDDSYPEYITLHVPSNALESYKTTAPWSSFGTIVALGASIITIPSQPVLISTQGGTITLTGLAESTDVAVYTTAGTQLGTATAVSGTATITTSLTTGNTAIVKIGDRSVKVVVK